MDYKHTCHHCSAHHSVASTPLPNMRRKQVSYSKDGRTYTTLDGRTILTVEGMKAQEELKGNPRFIEGQFARPTETSVLTSPTVDGIQLYRNARKNPKSIYVEKGSNWVK